MITLRYGTCSLCGCDLIDWEKKRLSDNSVRHYIEVNRYWVFVVLLCDHCRESLVKGEDVSQSAQIIVDLHKEYWRENPQDAPDGFEDWKVTDPNTSDKKHKYNLEKYEEEKIIKSLMQQ